MIVQPLLAIRVLAFITAIILFWLVSTQTKEVKKHVTEGFVSFLTTWILLFIGAKLLTKWQLLLDHPIALLAYPSGTLEFYIATAAITVIKLYKNKSSIYTHEYVQLIAFSWFSFSVFTIVFNDEGAWSELILTFLFIILITLVNIPILTVIFIVLLTGIYGLFYPSPELMGYRMDPWFYIGIALLCSLLLLFDKRRDLP
ncbi:hypothetical protein LF817_01965 [Halobacillus sp. A1]|uniref:hypothetical protein n=1 Tax=Halobacillus sp. A1 TaxID=2880262 RepID=UPI0020A6A0AF|nr:hypothetical protein [Halobacillus sp. A1]MCP3030101.1 hypothetical protein [Halobacillus sp. A1]